ncbi:MAG: PHP domain-containing protein [Candidatus Glassbacteria bacterium]|nr:PHP domain-containing protein [Candidatus Glassbacteria bacterium]
MPLRADLHIHSAYSDGKMNVTELVPLARERGLHVLGITDHDTVDHYGDALACGREHGLTMICGTEFSTRLGERELHILGYGLDPAEPRLVRHIDGVRQRRKERAHEILSLLNERNVRIPHDELDRVPRLKTIGRVLIADLIYNYGYVRSPEEAFDVYLGNNGSAFVPYSPADALEVIELIGELGGVSALAHPSRDEVEDSVDLLCEAGMDGIELWRPGVYRSTANAIRNKGRQHDLVFTGGSDWHYEGGRFNLGEFHISTARLARFFDLLGVKPERSAD